MYTYGLGDLFSDDCDDGEFRPCDDCGTPIKRRGGKRRCASCFSHHREFYAEDYRATKREERKS